VMRFKNWPVDAITVNNKEIPVKVGQLSQLDLEFYPDNPRLYSLIKSAGGMDQLEIQSSLLQMEHVRQLINSIRSNGGLTDPLLIAPIDGRLVVVEGNSRLAAYRALAKKEPEKWGVVKCRILPEGTNEDDLFSILGEYHIIGRKDWMPYEQAGYLFRRHKHQKRSIESISLELGMSTREVGHLISVYSFMVDHDENQPDRWSYYDVYFRINKVKKVRKDHQNLDKKIIQKIRSGEIHTAQDLRDKLPKILASSEKTIHKFLHGEVNFEDSFERALLQGADNPFFKRLSKFRTWITDIADISSDLTEMPESQRSKCFYEIKKIDQALKSIARAFPHELHL
jgi:hypothetical protein